MRKLLPFVFMILISFSLIAQTSRESEKKVIVKKKMIHADDSHTGIIADLSKDDVQLQVEIEEVDGENVINITIITETDEGIQKKVISKVLTGDQSFEMLDLSDILQGQIDEEVLAKISGILDLSGDDDNLIKVLIDDTNENIFDFQDGIKKIIIINDGDIRTIELNDDDDDDDFFEWNQFDDFDISSKCKDGKNMFFISEDGSQLNCPSAPHEMMLMNNNCGPTGKCTPMESCCSPNDSGGWGLEVFLFDFDFGKLNGFLSSADFSPVAADGALMFGGRGAASIGNGWYLGAMGAGMSQEQRIDVPDGSRYLRFSSGFGGATLAKRLLLDSSFSLEGEMMFGGGATEVEISETRGNPTFDDFQSNLDNVDSFNFQQAFLAIQPSIGLMYKIKDWLSLRGSVSYLATYEYDWKNMPSNNVIEGEAPDNINGLNYSASLWFGF